jgi:hypothetical protein
MKGYAGSSYSTSFGYFVGYFTLPPTSGPWTTTGTNTVGFISSTYDLHSCVSSTSSTLTDTISSLALTTGSTTCTTATVTVSTYSTVISANAFTASGFITSS